ncbi:hypothetical protein LTR08_007225 [Meristemomyces frigidus]|nr:hypothetical protein LTR08_007225 [Meristemomyces frigidus]
MSKAASSPTARLLQTSRLFSLPRPLPAPAYEALTSTGMYRASDTATLPYPTHQALATPASSYSRGDWGLKRPLPAQATRGSGAPCIRVAAQDTSEHITDFGSAADHTQTAAKWRELGVPLLYRPAQRAKAPPVSVFEESGDNTDAGGPVQGRGVGGVPGRGAPMGGEQKPRWKYSGPWIAGLPEGDFQRFTRQVAKRKADFRAFLETHVAEQKLADRRRQAQDQGESLSLAQIAQLRVQLRPDAAELRGVEKALRDAHALDGLSSELTHLITAFFDLPAVAPDSPASTPDVRSSLLRDTLNAITDDASAADAAPPSTHPSAGLSYLRTNAVMDNHPLHGPQAHRAPVLARVVRPRNSAQGTEYVAKLGVAGFIAPDSVSASLNTDRSTRNTALTNSPLLSYDPDAMAHSLDPDLPGGNKMWVHPQHAYVDEHGRVRLTLSRGDREAIAVRSGDVEAIHAARDAATRGMAGARALPGTAGNANFGFSLAGRGGGASSSSAALGQGMPAFAGQQRQQPRGGEVGRGGRDGEGGRAGEGGYSSTTPSYPPAPEPEYRRERRQAVTGFDEELGRRAGQGRMDDESALARIRDLAEGRR